MTDQTRNMDTNNAGNPGSYAADIPSAPEFSFSKESTVDGAMERYDHATDVSHSFTRKSGNGGYQAKRTVVLPATDSSPEQKLRAQLSKDSSYPEQTSLKVEVWTAQGWSEVIVEHGNPVDDTLPSGYVRSITDAEFEDTAHRVLSDHIIDAIRVVS